MIEELHEVLLDEFHTGAYQWADDNYDKGWTKSVERFEKAIVEATRTNNPHLFQQELRVYKESTLKFFIEYKKIDNEASTRSFIGLLYEKSSKK